MAITEMTSLGPVLEYVQLVISETTAPTNAYRPVRQVQSSSEISSPTPVFTTVHIVYMLTSSLIDSVFLLALPLTLLKILQ